MNMSSQPKLHEAKEINKHFDLTMKGAKNVVTKFEQAAQGLYALNKLRD